MGVGLICDHCQGEVNVSMHHGATLRCGCGKTTRMVKVEPIGVMAPPLIAILDTMVKYKALRVRAGDLEVELSPEAFAPRWPAQNSSLGNVDEKQCRCGHSIEVEHNDAGQCLQGCEPDACAPPSGAQ